MALHVAAFLEMLAKSVATKATTATRAVCVRRGLGHNTPFSERQDVAAGGAHILKHSIGCMQQPVDQT